MIIFNEKQQKQIKMTLLESLEDKNVKDRLRKKQENKLPISVRLKTQTCSRKLDRIIRNLECAHI
jgi:hypothetical protein